LEKKIGKHGVLLVENHRSTAPPASSIDSKKLIKQPAKVDTSSQKTVEIGGQKGPEPTRYGDWEKAGRCTDF
jgi:hypothetical protein